MPNLNRREKIQYFDNLLNTNLQKSQVVFCDQSLQVGGVLENSHNLREVILDSKVNDLILSDSNRLNIISCPHSLVFEVLNSSPKVHFLRFKKLNEMLDVIHVTIILNCYHNSVACDWMLLFNELLICHKGSEGVKDFEDLSLIQGLWEIEARDPIWKGLAEC